MDIIGDLHTDHINSARLLDFLDGQLRALGAGAVPDFVLLGDVMYYMTQYPDLFHHPKEEVVFAMLSERDACATTVLEELKRQHEELAVQGKQLYSDLQTAGLGGGDTTDLLRSLRGYVELSRRHMDTEESQVFPLARALLSRRDWMAVAQQVQSIDDPLFGSVVNDHYRRLHAVIAATTD